MIAVLIATGLVGLQIPGPCEASSFALGRFAASKNLILTAQAASISTNPAFNHHTSLPLQKEPYVGTGVDWPVLLAYLGCRSERDFKSFSNRYVQEILGAGWRGGLPVANPAVSTEPRLLLDSIPTMSLAKARLYQASYRFKNDGITGVTVWQSGFAPNTVAILRDNLGRLVPLTPEGRACARNFIRRDRDGSRPVWVPRGTALPSDTPPLGDLFCLRPGRFDLSLVYWERGDDDLRLASNEISVEVLSNAIKP